MQKTTADILRAILTEGRVLVTKDSPRRWGAMQDLAEHGLIRMEPVQGIAGAVVASLASFSKAPDVTPQEDTSEAPTGDSAVTVNDTGTNDASQDDAVAVGTLAWPAADAAPL